MTDQATVTTTCEGCGQQYKTSYRRFQGFPTSRYCPDCREARDRALEAERREIHEKSLAYQRGLWLEHAITGIPLRYRGQRWEDFLFDQGGDANRRRVDLVHQYAEEFPVESSPAGVRSLVLASEMNGVGKTMLACLMLKRIMERFDDNRWERCPFQLWTVGAMRRRLRRAERFGSEETQEDVVRDFATMRLLVLDDVGKEQLAGTEAAFAYEMYFTVINDRYNALLPVVLTSNLNFSPWREGGPSLVDLMGRASVSRLVEMTSGQVVVIEGSDRR